MTAISKPFKSYEMRGRAKRGEPRQADPARDIGHEHRRAMGTWLQQKHIDAGLTQRDLAELLAAPGERPKGFTAISAVETGNNPVPSVEYEAWARALGLDRQEFAKRLLKHTNPWLFDLMFSKPPKAPSGRKN